MWKTLAPGMPYEIISERVVEIQRDVFMYFIDYTKAHGVSESRDSFLAVWTPKIRICVHTRGPKTDQNTLFSCKLH